MANIFIERLDGRPVNKTLVQTVIIDPLNPKAVQWFLKNGETFDEECASEAAALDRLDEVRTMLLAGGGGGGGTDNYSALTNKPKINNITLVGNKSADDLNLQSKLVKGDNIELKDNPDGTVEISAVGGSGSGSLSADMTVSNPLGKYGMNDVILQGTEFESIFRGILSKTYYPTLTPPSASLSYSVDSLYKVGAVISARNATISLNRGSINPKYNATSSFRSGEATGYSISLSGANISYTDSNTTGIFNVPDFTKTAKGNVILSATVNYAAGVQPYDSDGNKYDSPLPAGSKSTSKAIEFMLPFYYGANDTKDIDSVHGFNEDLSRKGNKTYSITTNNQYLVLIYDSSYGDLTSIKDVNNFELIDGWSKVTKIIDGQSYNIWTSDGRTTDINAEFIFKF